MGTPSYMAPEQARGEVDRLDERCDVFALGSILCEILTGEPAFTGRSSGEIQRKASRGELKDAVDRLDACGADAELIALAKRLPCLRARRPPAPCRRSPSGSSPIGPACRSDCARPRSPEPRKRPAPRKPPSEPGLNATACASTVALAASVLGLILLGGGGWTYIAQIRAARQAATERVVTQALDEANLFRGQAKAAPVGNLGMWTEAYAMAKQARALLLEGEPTAALHARVDALLADIEREQAEAAQRAAEATRDQRFLERLEAIRVERFEQGAEWAPNVTDASYMTAFRDFGIDIDQLDPTEAGRRVRERSNRLELAFFLDDWALVRLEALEGPGLLATPDFRSPRRRPRPLAKRASRPGR